MAGYQEGVKVGYALALEDLRSIALDPETGAKFFEAMRALILSITDPNRFARVRLEGSRFPPAVLDQLRRMEGTEFPLSNEELVALLDPGDDAHVEALRAVYDRLRAVATRRGMELIEE